MTRLSMAQFVVLCLIVLGFARRVQAQHAAPPPIVLTRPPAAELAPVPLARRPFELNVQLLLGFPSCTDGNASSRRCTGLAAGPGLGAALLWRPSPYFAVGAVAAGSGFAFRPAPASGSSDASAAGHFYGVLGRVYFFDQGWFEPYVELAIGEAGLHTSARETDAAYEEASSGLALRTSGALEFYLSRHVRLGPALAWTRFRVDQLRRCAGSNCIDLDRASSTRGTGFSEVSLRLSVVLGPSE